MATEYFHTGSVYSMEPGYGQAFESYQSNIGLATDPRTANQLQEISKKLNVGARAIELSTVSADVFESIPDQHLEEIKRLSKLTGVDITLHAPIIEPSGFSKEGWSESNRQMTERQMLLTVERARKLNSSGNMPVTFHASAMLPEETVRVKEGGKEFEKVFHIVDPQSGNISVLKEREEFLERPEKEAKKFEPLDELKRQNREIWAKTLNEVAFYADRGMGMIGEGIRNLTGVKDKAIMEKEGLIKPGIKEEDMENAAFGLYSLAKKKKDEFENKFVKSDNPELRAIGNDIKESSRLFDHAEIFMEDSYNHMKELFNRVYKDASGEQKEKLKEYAQKIRTELPNIRKDPAKVKDFAELIDQGISVLKEIEPKIFKPLGEFVVEKSAETFGNVAWQAFQKAKPEERGRLPIISIENPPVGGFGGRAEELKELVEKSRKVFEKKAKESGMSSNEARKKAEQLIGATWDVGHINMLRKLGYGEKELLAQTEKIAPMVKHVHLSDNFGMEHTELPMGMGTVPIQKMLKQLEKEGFSGKKIIEAGNWYQHFKTIPMRETLAGMGMPVYAAKEAPYWSQAAGTYGRYFAGYGTFLPEEHISMYGAGFSGLPAELGGQVPGKQSRFSGAPME